MKFVLIPSSKARTPADLFIVGFFEKEQLTKETQALEPAFAKIAQLALKKGRYQGKFGEEFSFFHDSNKEATEVLLLGLGERKKYKPACLRKTVGKMVQYAKAHKASTLRVLFDSLITSEVPYASAGETLTEISMLASYEFDKYKTKKNENGNSRKKLESVEILFFKRQFQGSLEEAIQRSQKIAEATIRTRDLINEPGNVMNPQALARAARELAVQKKIACEILGPAELKRLKMGGILAVNQGSRTPPALIVLEYGARFKNKKTICLVGKGVTFDTGGISIKPAKDMEKMKYDMSGAAAVIATMGLVADLKLPLHVVGLAPAVENMVAENPQRPGDIIHMYNGKSVEVLNTDAEGRLILADALAYAEKYRPHAIIDLATLTGMCAYTFGDKAIGLMGNHPRLLDRVKKAGEESGERCWELPLWDDYAEQIKGHHSDLYNIGGPYAGTITAAMFLKEFVPGKTPWAHLDIAGTAWCDNARYDGPKGATGVGVRLLARLLSNW
jgi:leucyl aminopeptidase